MKKKTWENEEKKKTKSKENKGKTKTKTNKGKRKQQNKEENKKTKEIAVVSWSTSQELAITVADVCLVLVLNSVSVVFLQLLSACVTLYMCTYTRR